MLRPLIRCNRSLLTTQRLCRPNYRLSFCTEARDDDEFMFPVQVVRDMKVSYLWSGSDIAQLCDIGAGSFDVEKKIVYARKNVKVVRVRHVSDGYMSFTLIPDKQNTWKICSIAVFGNDIEESYNDVEFFTGGVCDLVGALNSKTSSGFSQPYQYVCPPYALKTTDRISEYISHSGICKDGSAFSHYCTSLVPSKHLIGTSKLVYQETSVLVQDTAENNVAVIDLLLLVDRTLPENRILGVVISSEKSLECNSSKNDSCL
mmetsp:Transcript_3833/g.5962  ORF Transcript_3833/g.5962 Transcript_3833/m.5962 type:complete len:260 (-) Transcript_3833:72-851(-)